jgi:hypothetical protein
LALSMRKEYQYCNWDLFLDWQSSIQEELKALN